MALQYMPGGGIKEHDHAFEEGFFFVEGQLEARPRRRDLHTFGAGDYFWSGVGSMHELANRSDAPVRWLETQAPQPPSRHQFRYRGDWERLAAAVARQRRPAPGRRRQDQRTGACLEPGPGSQRPELVERGDDQLGAERGRRSQPP